MNDVQWFVHYIFYLKIIIIS